MRDIGRGVKFAAPRREAGCYHFVEVNKMVGVFFNLKAT